MVAVNSISDPSGLAVRLYCPSSISGTSNEATALPASEVDACTSGITSLFASVSVYSTHLTTGWPPLKAAMVTALSPPEKSVLGASIRNSSPEIDVPSSHWPAILEDVPSEFRHPETKMDINISDKTSNLKILDISLPSNSHIRIC